MDQMIGSSVIAVSGKIITRHSVDQRMALPRGQTPAGRKECEHPDTNSTAVNVLFNLFDDFQPALRLSSGMPPTVLVSVLHHHFMRPAQGKAPICGTA